MAKYWAEVNPPAAPEVPDNPLPLFWPVALPLASPSPVDKGEASMVIVPFKQSDKFPLTAQTSQFFSPTEPKTRLKAESTL